MVTFNDEYFLESLITIRVKLNAKVQTTAMAEGAIFVQFNLDVHRAFFSFR